MIEFCITVEKLKYLDLPSGSDKVCALTGTNCYYLIGNFSYIVRGMKATVY